MLRTLDGTTVEVLNTDAEGRLVLADGLAAASRENPDLIVDVATLTGAITVALGNRHTGVMGEDAAVASYLAAAGRTAELAWQLPLPDHMVDDLDSPIADLQNAKIGGPRRRLAVRRTVPAPLRRSGVGGRRCAAHPVGAPRHRGSGHE